MLNKTDGTTYYYFVPFIYFVIGTQFEISNV